MDILYQSTLPTILENNYLLLDTNVFRDSSSSPNAYREFFNTLKKSHVTLATIDFVKFELLKGSLSMAKHNDREVIIDGIIDVILPFSSQTIALTYELIKKYGVDGASLNPTDLILGATLMHYKQNIYLMTRDTTDFIQRIFDLKSVINVPLNRGIFTYGIYQCKL